MRKGYQLPLDLAFLGEAKETVPATLSCVECVCAKLDVSQCDDSDQCVGIVIIAADDLVESAAAIR